MDSSKIKMSAKSQPVRPRGQADLESFDVRSERTTRRRRVLTEKGKEFQFHILMKSLKSKRSELASHIRKTLILCGQCDSPSQWKSEFSRAQVLLAEFRDIFNEIVEINLAKEELSEAERCHEQIMNEWRDFEHDARAEIEHLERLSEGKLENECESTKSSSKRSSRSKVSRVHTVKDQRLELEKKGLF